MYAKILVPLDGSRLAEQILPYVRLLAEVYGVPVELLRVHDADVRPPFWPPLPSPDYLQQIAADYFPSSLRVDHVEASGKPADVIVDRGKTDPSSLIAMMTHGLSGIRRWLLGSVASQVVQCAANPILLIRSRDDNETASAISLKTVFVPLDGSPLAERILPHIVPLAEKMKLEVDLVRVYSSPADAYPVGDAVYMETLARHRETIHREAESYLDAKAEELRAEGLHRVLTTTILGDPAEEIIGLACNTPDSLIAMSTHGRSGVGRWVLGSVAEKVVQYSRDPVLIVRPNKE
jgi:nucleotide-binding universal stress UspA family protein